MSDYMKKKIAEGFYSIEQGFVRSFLFVGQKEALLVDTGVGGDLREFVEEITELPVKVILTHADGDHTGAAAQFDLCLMHPAEFGYYMGKNINAVPVSPIWEGDMIELGNYRFEVILLPGHTPGSIALLEREKRFLIGGDSIQTESMYMFGNGRNFGAFCASMIKLKRLLGTIDTIYSSHGEVALNPEIVNQLYSGAGRVMEKKVEGIPVILHGKAVHRYDTEGVSFFAE